MMRVPKVGASEFRGWPTYGGPYVREWDKAAGSAPLPATGEVRLVDVALDVPRTGGVTLVTDAPGAGVWIVTEGSQYAQTVRTIIPAGNGQDVVQVNGQAVRVSWRTTGAITAGDRCAASYGVRA
jgi:hypothetical protein